MSLKVIVNNPKPLKPLSSVWALVWAPIHITSEHLPSVNVKYMCAKYSL